MLPAEISQNLQYQDRMVAETNPRIYSLHDAFLVYDIFYSATS